MPTLPFKHGVRNGNETGFINFHMKSLGRYFSVFPYLPIGKYHSYFYKTGSGEKRNKNVPREKYLSKQIKLVAHLLLIKQVSYQSHFPWRAKENYQLQWLASLVTKISNYSHTSQYYFIFVNFSCPLLQREVYWDESESFWLEGRRWTSSEGIGIIAFPTLLK